MGDGAKGTVTSLDALFPVEEASRAARRVEEAISERSGELRRIRGFAADNAALVSLVQKLPDELSHDIMVPFGGAAFFPGRLIHTNEFMVLLGEGYYAERTAKQTAEILRRRGKDLEAQIESLKATMLDLEAEAKFFNSTAAEAAEGLVEIREDYVEENQEKVSEPVNDDRIKERNGVLPTRGKLYVVHHKKKNGEPVTELARKRIEKLEPLIQKELDASKTASSGGSLMWPATDAFAEVIGKERHGHIRGVGFGPTPSMFGASSVNTSQRLRMVPEEEILRDKEEIRDLKDRLKFIEAKVAFLLSQQSDTCSSPVKEVAGDIILERSNTSDNSRDGKGASASEQQGFQAIETAQRRKRRRLRKSFGQTKCGDENHLK